MANLEVHLSDGLPELTPEIFTSASAIVGIRGSGKTNTGVLLNEQAIHFGVPVAIIDPTGVWHGLKSSRDGLHPGLPVYVFGGQHGDVPLEPDAGAIVARFIVDERVPIVLDLSDLTKTKQRRFVGQFCEALYDLKARSRDPLLLTIDEAARFIPQQLQRGDIELSKCVGAVEDIVALGRSRGLGCAIIGQRPATINKNVLTQCDNLVALRTVGAQDRKAIDEWVVEAQGNPEQRDELVRHLAALPQGEGYFWSPAIFGVFRRVKFAARSTFDSSRTPKVGEKRIEPKAFASVDLDALRGEIASAVERAKADDPKALRARIAELERAVKGLDNADAVEVKQLRARVAELDAREPERVEVSVLDADDRGGLRAIAADIHQRAQDLRETADRIVAAIARLEAPVVARPAAGEPRERPQSVSAAPAPREAVEPRPRSTRVEAGSIRGGARRMLQQLARCGGSLSKQQLGVLAEVNSGSGTFSTYLGDLRAAGYIENGVRSVTITAAGAAFIGERIRRDPPTTADVVKIYEPKLRAGARRMLHVLVAAHPKHVPKAQLAEQSGVDAGSGTFSTYLGDLRRIGLLADVDSRTVRAGDALFPARMIR